MRILLINQHVGLPGAAGGTRHHSLARELVRRGHEVTIVCTSFAHMTRTERLAPGEDYKQETLDGVSFIWLRTPPYAGNTGARLWNMLVFARKVLQVARRTRLPQPDVVIGSSPQPFAALAAERLARALGAPFVLEVRDLWPQTLIDLGRISPRHPLIVLMGAVERHLYQQACRIISLLPGATDHMVAKGAAPEKVVWLPNGVDFSLVPEGGPAAERDYFTVLYAGTHGLSNALDTVLDAAHVVGRRGLGGRIRFRFVGDGPAKAALEQRTLREGLSSLVTFEPAVPKAAVFAVMQESDCCVMTMHDTPLYRWGISPNKLYDYLAAGRPVVLACNCPYDPVTEAGAGYTVPPADPEALAGAIIRLYELDGAERVAMGRRGRAYALEHHSFPRLGARLEAVLADCLPAAEVVS
jgi:glycosyltransferase involved in cell wall biosynthesis